MSGLDSSSPPLLTDGANAFGVDGAGIGLAIGIVGGSAGIPMAGGRGSGIADARCICWCCCICCICCCTCDCCGIC